MRHRLSRTGCGVPRVALHATPGRHRKPALRHYERDLRMQQCRTEGHRSCATSQRNGQGGLGAKKTAAVERREASVPRRADCESQIRAGTCAGHVSASAHNNGCRRTRAPVGAPPPSLCVSGRLAKLGGHAPRENDVARHARAAARLAVRRTRLQGSQKPAEHKNQRLQE